MTFKTTQARALPTRVVITYAGTEAAPITPVAATAYDRNGKIVIATANVKDAPGVVEFTKTERVRWSADIEGTRGVYWCKKCPEKHARRISTTKYAATYCDVQEKALAKARKEQGETYVPVRVQIAEQREAERAERIESVLSSRTLTREQMIANTLTHVWNNAVGAPAEKVAARIEALAGQYGMSVEVAMTRIGQGTVEAVAAPAVSA